MNVTTDELLKIIGRQQVMIELLQQKKEPPRDNGDLATWAKPTAHATIQEG